MTGLKYKKVTDEYFLNCVKDHFIIVLRDDGLNRHIRFSRGDLCYHFEIITWFDHLCISGDCGTYVFKNNKDMFDFFRMDKDDFNYEPSKKLNIEKYYWGNKLVSVCNWGGYKKFDESKFIECLKYEFDQWEFENEKQKTEVWKEIEIDVINYSWDNEHKAIHLANIFSSSYGHQFENFCEHSITTFTKNYVWSLYAIAWGIKMYDKEKELL